MLIAALAIVGQLAGLSPLPPPPTGTWSCALSGEFAGTLTVEGLTYVFADTMGGTAEAGALATTRARLGAKSRASLVRIWSGPLSDTFGIALGFHNRAASPETLVFNIGPGKGLQCLRA
jgi:hypothetical protein